MQKCAKNRQKIPKAQEELSQLREILANPTLSQLTIFDLNGIEQILKIAEAILAGEIAAQQGDYDSAVASLKKAVQLEDELNYNEPKDWYLPPR